jgi:hypothetical protein
VSISPFFLSLRNGYQAEIDDLTFDSEGQNILRQRLAERRKELGFLLQMMELSPEMVAVVLHQGFRFKLPAAMDHLLSHESEELPEWDTLSDVVDLTPWAQELAKVILKQPRGAWFMSVAAGLEYLFGKIEHTPRNHAEDEDDEGDGNQEADAFDSEEERAARAREEAGADWMVEQGFDRKD